MVLRGLQSVSAMLGVPVVPEDQTGVGYMQIISLQFLFSFCIVEFPSPGHETWLRIGVPSSQGLNSVAGIRGHTFRGVLLFKTQGACLSHSLSGCGAFALEVPAWLAPAHLFP